MKQLQQVDYLYTSATVSQVDMSWIFTTKFMPYWFRYLCLFKLFEKSIRAIHESSRKIATSNTRISIWKGTQRLNSAKDVRICSSCATNDGYEFKADVILRFPMKWLVSEQVSFFAVPTTWGNLNDAEERTRGYEQ